MSWTNTLLDGVKAIAPSLVSFIPGVGPMASEGLKHILRGMKGDESETDDQIMERIAQDPKLFAELKIYAMKQELELEQERTKSLEIVNKTMQSEAMSESTAQRSWRPFNGYMFGITLFCDYFVSQIVMILTSTVGTDGVAKIIFTWNHIPASVYVLWSMVLGVTAGSRGIEKVAKTKAQNGGQMLGLMNTLKTFAEGVIKR